MKIGIVVGEVSGDNLGASLIEALKQLYPNITIEGVAGPKLLQTGCHALYPMESINLMGLIEPLAHIPRLYRMRSHLIQHFTQNPPDVFIGIDSPDFNLGLECALRAQGIRTVHYVSPSVWAWRKGRIHTIKRAVDLMLTLFPFETKIYQEHNIPVAFVGHPFADEISLDIDVEGARKALGVDSNQKIIGVFPGSRNTELKYLAEIYVKTIMRCYEQDNKLFFLVPLVRESHKIQFDALCRKYALNVPMKTFVGNARLVMAACDVALVTSGTAAFEIMLHKKPMVVAYRMNALTYQLAKRLVKLPYISLPNLLLGEKCVPEFIQDEVNLKNLSQALLLQLEDVEGRKVQTQRFMNIHRTLRCDASMTSAKEIAGIIRR